MSRRHLLAAAALILAVVVGAGWWARGAALRASEAEGRYQAERTVRIDRERAVEALLPALEARDRDLVERLVAAQAREKALTDQLARARRDTGVAADRATALRTAPLADVLRAGEALGIKARAR